MSTLRSKDWKVSNGTTLSKRGTLGGIATVCNIDNLEVQHMKGT